MREFKLPDPGEGLLEAEIVSWKVAVGDTVAVNDILLEIETAKSLVELPSPHAGVVSAILVAEGDTVEVGTPIIRIGDAGEAQESSQPTVIPASQPNVIPAQAGISEATPTTETAAVTGNIQDELGEVPVAATDKPTEPPAQSGAMLVGYGVKPGAVARRPRKGPGVVAVPETDQVQESYDTANPVSRRVDEVTPTSRVSAQPSGAHLPPPGRPPAATPPDGPPRAKPPVRRIARDLGIDLNGIEGTGPGGTITAEDVVAAAGGPSADRRVPLRGVQRQMFRTMTESLKVPQATAMVEADVTGTMELLETLKSRREFTGLRVSPLLVFAKAACMAIARNPSINSGYDEATDEIVLHGAVNLGIAAATPRGLVVPNIKGADRMNLLELAQALNQMVAVAKEGRVQPGDLASGTFTITNVGVFGVDGGTPILNEGEAAIMCLGTVRRKPWVVGTGDEERIVPRSVCMVSLTFDHRLVDGEAASKFLADVATIMAEPGLSLLF
ncbi:MAG TPA: 2-oxo acid dehydrogenase subunit E2 [Propionicimonas sp.]|nr:2-oxo acid dehydrogenase subunit E2 [Propionicimonas sp.]HQA77447.1 2-oxo acid dehydrogenase subunit E2 [Propionicimonas sp.]HQD96424.1 2-oxo acid dehydrogenase subunit E2 [Propionicimonas sp.]